jgi:transcriptional regulator with XRE-family HTH domain
MGYRARKRPRKLGAKLRQIREATGLSQTDMWKALKLTNETSYTAISGYEQGKREPSLITLLNYARLAGVSVDELIDDKIRIEINTKKIMRKLLVGL